MRKLLILTSVMLMVLTQSFAQTKTGRIAGSIKDVAGKSVPAVSVSLQKAVDSSLVKLSVSNKEGGYEFLNIAHGKYFLVLTAVGFDKKSSSVFELIAENVNLETLEMNFAAKGLSEVKVTATRPFIETKIDRTIVNVDASPSSAGATALEILEKSPGISVDNDGAISLRGKAGVIVMLDGKPSYLSPTDLVNLLKNMPASSIDQIEIMTNPPAKYDAAGNSGIINIKTKKGKAGGFNGSVMVGATAGFFSSHGTLYVTPRSQNSFTFNYRKNKINLFGNYNPNYSRGMSNLEINRKFVDGNGNVTAYSDVLTRFKFGNNNHTLKLGLDYMPNAKNTYGMVVTGFMFFGHPTPVTTTDIKNPSHEIESTLVSTTANRITFKNLSANFNYRHEFDTSGTEITADLDYIGYSNSSKMLLTTNFYDGHGQMTADPLYLQNYLPSKINVYSAKADYTHPFKKNGRIDAGFKTSYVNNDNLVDYQRLDDDEWIPDNRSNHFVYKENINALYISATRQFGKWNFQGGLRLENTIANGHQVTNDSTFRRDFTSLFPSAYINYVFNPNNSLTFSYSRRITRPNYQDLNPFTYFLDSLSYRQGNPYLLPQFTHNNELSYAFKSKFIFAVNYTVTRDVIAQILKQDAQSKIVFATADNVARFRNMGLSITAPFKWTKWWSTNFFGNVYNNHYTGVYFADPIDIGYPSFMINVSNTFTVKQGFTIELSGWYRAKGVEQLSINDPMYVFSVAGQKQIMKGKGTLRLNFRDPLWLQKYGGTTKYSSIDVRIRNRWDNRQVTATFTYRFGKNTQQAAPPRRRTSATQDEQNRVGGNQ